MVFPGRLSTGCRLCRRRKVKCDETKPGCNRCAVYGRPCPGYGDNFQFRPQEAKVKKAVSSSTTTSASSSTSSRPSDAKVNAAAAAVVVTSGEAPAFRVKQRTPSGSSGSDTGSSVAYTSTTPPGQTVFQEIVFKQESPGSEEEYITKIEHRDSDPQQWQYEHQFSLSPPRRQRPQQGGQQQQQQQQRQQQKKQQRQQHQQQQYQYQYQHEGNLQLNFAESYQQWLGQPGVLARVRPQPLPSPPPTQDRGQQSLCYFMHRFVARRVADPFPGHLSFLHDLYDGDNITSLELATLSAAEMAAYNKFGLPEMKQRAYRHRGAAIRALSTALGSPDRNVRFNDKTIGTVLLLTTFADISGEGPARDAGHASGLYYLLEQRGQEQLMSPIGSEIFFLGVMKLHISAFVTADGTYADPGGYSEMMQDVDPLWRGRALVCKIPRLRGQLGDHLKAMAKRYKLSTSRDGKDTVPLNKDEPPPPPLQEDDLMQTMEMYMGCMQVLHGLSEWDKTIAASPQFNPDIVEIQTPVTPGGGSPGSSFSPLPGGDPAAGPRPRYDSSTACSVILLKSSRVMLLLSLLAYLKRLKDWIVANPRLMSGDLNSPIASMLAAAFMNPSESMADVGKLLDDVRESVDEIERCIPLAIGREEDDLDGIASYQGSFSSGYRGGYRDHAGSGNSPDGNSPPSVSTPTGSTISNTTASSSVYDYLGSMRRQRRQNNQTEVAAAALIIMHSVILMYMCPYSTPQQKKLSLDVLNRMDKNMGIRAARLKLKGLLEEETKGLFF